MERRAVLPSSLRGLPAAGPAPKRYLAGTHRTASPEETLAAFAPLMPRMGITRLADITGLDVLDIPVFIACRPNSRSLAVFQGKGVSAAAAKVSAMMEAAETYHAETITLPLRWARHGDLDGALTLAELGTLPKARAPRFDAAAPLLWIAARELISGEPAWP